MRRCIETIGRLILVSKTKQLKETVGFTDEVFITIVSPQPGETEAVKKVPSFKRPGLLSDQMLKYQYPKSNQLTLWAETLTDIEELKNREDVIYNSTETIEGIKLSATETKVIDCLCKLLHNSSQTFDPKKEGYYTGNMGAVEVEYTLKDTNGKLVNKTATSPKIACSLYKLTREYIGGDEPGGNDIKNVEATLKELEKKRFLIRYCEQYKTPKGEWIKMEYEAVRTLLNLDKATLSRGVGDIEEYKKTEVIIQLNPIFRRQIDSKFILYPSDIIKRTQEAYGSHNISSPAIILRDYLMREHSSKHYTPEIKLESLYYLLAGKWMREHRKKLVKEFTEKAIETVKALGLLISYEIKPSYSGEPKIVFKLNKEWLSIPK
jgi:hypothetical protein